MVAKRWLEWTVPASEATVEVDLASERSEEGGMIALPLSRVVRWHGGSADLSPQHSEADTPTVGPL